MKKWKINVLIVLYLGLHTNEVFSQKPGFDYLIMENSAEGQTHYVREGKNTKVWINDSTHFRGKFELINDSTILIQEKEFILNDIQQIRGRTKKRRIVGSILVLPAIGAGFLGGFMCLLGSDNGSNTIYHYLLPLNAAPLTSVLFLSFDGKKVKMSEEWKLSTKKL